MSEPKAQPRRLNTVNPISGPLRDALNASDRTHYALEAESGVDRKALGLFAKGLGSLNLASADALAEALGLRLPLVGRPRGRKARR